MAFLQIPHTSNLKKQNTYSFFKCPQSYFNLLATSKITDTTIDRIFSFKCLSLIFTPMHSSSSSSRIFYSTRKKAKNQFYIRCSSSTLLTLCKLLIHPILEYTCCSDMGFHISHQPLPSLNLLPNKSKKKEPIKIIQLGK